MPTAVHTALTRVRDFYGAHPLHLLVLVAAFVLTGYVVSVVGPGSLLGSGSWWQSILVWFVGAFLVHDLLLFPLYALADRSVSAGLQAVRGRRGDEQRAAVPVLNYLRVPALATGLTFLLFFPGIIEQGQGTYLAATGLTQQPYLQRWLLLTAAMFAVSAAVYAIRLSRGRRRQRAAE